MEKVDLGKVTGKSAYEIALDNGFEGTEEEWLDSLKGESSSGGNNVAYVDTQTTGLTGIGNNLTLSTQSDWETMFIEGFLQNKQIYNFNGIIPKKIGQHHFNIEDEFNALDVFRGRSYGMMFVEGGSLWNEVQDYSHNFIHNNFETLSMWSCNISTLDFKIHDFFTLTSRQTKFITTGNPVHICNLANKYLFIHNLYDQKHSSVGRLDNIVISVFDYNWNYATWDMMKDLYLNRDDEWCDSYFKHGIGADLVLNKNNEDVIFYGKKEESLFITTSEKIWEITYKNRDIVLVEHDVKNRLYNTYTDNGLVFCENGWVLRENDYIKYLLTGVINEDQFISKMYDSEFVARDYILMSYIKDEENGMLHFEFKNIETGEVKKVVKKGERYQNFSKHYNFLIIKGDYSTGDTFVNLDTLASQNVKYDIFELGRGSYTTQLFTNKVFFNKKGIQTNFEAFGSVEMFARSFDYIENNNELLDFMFDWGTFYVNKYKEVLEYVRVGYIKSTSDEEEEW